MTFSTWTCSYRELNDALNIILTRLKAKTIERIFPEADSERKNRLISIAKSVIQHEHFSDAD